MDPFIGEIKMTGFNFPPVGYAPCDGRLLNISEYQALFALIGTIYGGNGQTNFAVPDLRGRLPNHQGQGPGLSNYVIGQKAGSDNVTLTANNLPSHTHTLAVGAVTANASEGIPAANLNLATAGNGEQIYSTSNTNTTLKPAATKPNTGGSAPVSVDQPYLAINFVISLEGIFPSQG